MIDYLWKDWLNQLTEWHITDYRTAFQITSSWFVILVDYMSVLFYFFIYSETDGCISNLSWFSTPPLKKKQAHNEEIPGKWLNWITPYWCGRDYYWMPFISKSWYKANQISKFLLELNNPFSGILSWCSKQISQMATEMSIQGLNLNCSFLNCPWSAVPLLVFEILILW